MLPLFASTYTSAAHDTTDSCSELISFTSIRTCSSKQFHTNNVGFSFKTIKLIHCKNKWQLKSTSINICTGIDICTGIIRYAGILRYTSFLV